MVCHLEILPGQDFLVGMVDSLVHREYTSCHDPTPPKHIR